MLILTKVANALQVVLFEQADELAKKRDSSNASGS